MSYRWSVVVLMSSFALAQATAPATETVSPDTPVITIDGLCDKPLSAQPATSSKAPENAVPGCKSVVTRGQLEAIGGMLTAKPTPAKMRRFAADLPELMLFAHTAQEQGLDKDPRFQDFYWYKTLQALQQVLLVTTQRKFNEVSDAGVEKFYKEHPDRFVQYTLMRVFVPKREPDTSHPNYDPAAQTAAKAKAAADDEEMLRVAKSIQREAAAGGDFEKLQEKAYKAAKSEEEPPDVDLGDKWTIDNMPKEYKDLLIHLQPGQVSEPAPHPFGWEIFKLVSKHTVPLKEARQMVQGLTMKDWRDALTATIHTQLNDGYFGPPEPAADDMGP
jgi:parvulin-like peptidyl-prolyl cis-trans isomerase-like protein